VRLGELQPVWRNVAGNGSGAKRVTGLDTDTDQTFETDVTGAIIPSALHTIIEGLTRRAPTAWCLTRAVRNAAETAPVFEEARRLADTGYTEIQLLGQTVNSYRDPSARRMTFSELLFAVAEVEGIRRVRFTTSHPSVFGADIVAAMDAHEEFATSASAGAIWFDAGSARHGPKLHPGTIP